MTQMTMTLPQSEQQKLARLIKEMQKTTGVEMKKVVRNVCRDICYAALKYTPAVKVGGSPQWVKRGKTFIPWHKKGGGIKMYSKEGGLTKAGWSGCLTRLGKPGKGGRQAKAWSEVKITTGRGKIGFTMSNTCPYIEDFDKGKNPKHVPLHIEQRAMQKVIKTTDKRLTKMAKRVAKKTIGI